MQLVKGGLNIQLKSQSQIILFQNKITLHTNTATIKRLPEKDKALTSWLPILRSNVIPIYMHIFKYE